MADPKTDKAVPTVQHDDRKLDEVLLAMDVVDTLRHRDQVLLKEMDKVGREDQLIERLREIYKNQGIEVPDHVLKEGVQALEERRFHYDPPKSGLSVRLAKIYVTRDRWLKPLMGALAAAAIGLGIYQFGVVGPAKAKSNAVQVELTETLPTELESLHADILSTTEDERARALAESYYQDGLAAAKDEQAAVAKQNIENLKLLKSDISETYEIRVVYGVNPDTGQEYRNSGVFRVYGNNDAQRSYYLIVRAYDPTGKIVSVPIQNDETLGYSRVNIWGQQVSKEVFDRIADDKADDRKIQENLIGTKRAGQYNPEFTVESPGGAITEW